MEGTQRGRNEVMIEAILCSHLQIGNHQAISFFHCVYRTKSVCAPVCLGLIPSSLTN